MAYINNILTNEVSKLKGEIIDLDHELKNMKFDAKAGSDQKEIKLDSLEKNNIEEINSLQDMASSVLDLF